MSRTRPWAAGLAVAVVAVLATATPASAHDKLVSSDPSAEQELKEAPSTVSLTFSADVLDMGAAVVVIDETDTDWVSAAPTIDGATVTAVLDDGMPESGYEIRWRVVSSDGHPISGIVPFSVGDAAGRPSTGSTGNAEAPAAASTPDTGDDASGDTGGTQDQTAQDGEGPGRAVLVGASGAAVALALLALVQFLRRRISASGADGTGADPGPSGTE